MEPLPYPNTLEEVVGLVKRLYQPGSPQELSKIQDILQTVQRSSDGWKLADSLLGINDELLQFFGSLTFTVKLNSDSESVADDDIPILRDRLIGWLINVASTDSSQMVIKKLCSTSVVFFLRFPENWKNCIRHVICSLCLGRVIPVEDLPKLPSSDILLRKADNRSKITALWFSAILVEEVGKVDGKNIKNLRFHDRIHSNVNEAVLLISDAITGSYIDDAGNRTNDVDTRLVREGIKAFQSWVFYSLRAILDSTHTFPELKRLTTPILNWMAHPEMFDVTCEVITDILTHYYTFLTPADESCLAGIVTSPWAAERYKQLISDDGDSEDSLQFGRLLVAYAEATVLKIARNFQSPQSRAVMKMLHGMLGIPGWPMADEEISGTTFEFWSSFAEFLLDPEGVENERLGAVLVAGKKEILQAIEEFWRKIRIPGGHRVQAWVSWTKDQRDGFMTFRKDVGDLVEVVYGVLGAQLFGRLVNQVLGALSQADKGGNVVWEDIEASLFCLNSLSDSLSDEPEEDESLKILFGGKLFVILADFGNHIPIKARQTAVNMIGSYSAFFERHSEFLPTVLNFLFISISTPTLARNASKSIASLCSSCRTTLTGELSTFLYQYKLFSATITADDIAKERVLCAISYVTQALSSDEDKLEPVKRLLGFVEQDVQECLLLVAQQHEDAKEVALLALRCLLSIGRGLQVPEDIPILLFGEGLPQPLSFWEQGEGLVVQRRLLEIVETLVISLEEDGEVVDAACAVFRTGFAETTPGPFVFAPQVITRFLLKRAKNGVRIETVLSTASTMVSSHSTDGSPNISAEVSQFLNLIVTLVEQVHDPQSDPEVSQSVVEFLNRMLSRYVNVLVHYQPSERVQMLFGFVLNALAVREPLVKKAAASFWATFVSLADHRPEVQASIDAVVAMCGTALAEKLVWVQKISPLTDFSIRELHGVNKYIKFQGVGGGAARSEVDSLAEPLKRLVARQVKAKSWLSTALAIEGFPSPNLTDKSKTRFLNTVISLRGKRGTNQIVKEFWLSARGSEFDYAS